MIFLDSNSKRRLFGKNFTQNVHERDIGSGKRQPLILRK